MTLSLLNRIIRPAALVAIANVACPNLQAQEASRFREWTSTNGQFTTDAELVHTSQGRVRLRKRDGKEVTVPLSRLSEADRLYVAARQRAIPPAAPVAAAPEIDDAPTTFPQVQRALSELRSPDQAIELLEWAANHLSDDKDRQAARESIPEWRARSEQGLLRHGSDWLAPHEIDARLAEEVTLLKEAHRLIDVKNDRLALDRFKDASRINPEGVRADFYLGLLNALVSHHPPTAVRNFDECVDRLEDNPDLLVGARRANLVAALNNLAVAEVRTMKFDRAIRHWDEAIQLSPQTPELVQNLGLLTRMGGTGAGSFFSNRVGDKAGALYAQATVANGSRQFDEGIGWLYMPYIDDVDGTLDVSGDNELLQVGWSTGVAVAPDLVLVPARSVAGADRFRIDGRHYGEVAAIDVDSDLALIRFDKLAAKPMRWSDYDPTVSTRFSLNGFSQPGYGAVGLRKLPTTLLESRGLAPFEVVSWNFNQVGQSGGIVVRRRVTLGGGRTLLHSFVGDPGLLGSVLCDDRGVGYGVHLGPRSSYARSGAKSSLAVPATRVAAFVSRSGTPLQVEQEAPEGLAETDDATAIHTELSNTVFQVASMKFAPRLKWSHRIASLHATGDVSGWASYEDRSCMACNGLGRDECPNRDCKRGRVTKYRTVTERGQGPFEGKTFTRQIPYKDPCSTCRGKGYVSCTTCKGGGKR